MSFLNPENWPFWIQSVRIALTILLTLVFGAHAWSQMQILAKRGESARKWVMALYGAAFLFAAWVNFILLVVAVYANHYEPGPYRVGPFTLLLLVAYLFTISFRRVHVRG